MSDHFGTIIEVGPEAQYCSPMKAKAAAQKRRLAGAPPPPNNDETRDKYLGVHNGNFAHGGANEWLFISEAGGYDFIHESRIPGPRHASSRQKENGHYILSICADSHRSRNVICASEILFMEVIEK